MANEFLAITIQCESGGIIKIVTVKNGKIIEN